MKLRRDIVTAALAFSLIAGVALASTSDTPAPLPVPANGPGYGMMNGPGTGYCGCGGPGMQAMGMMRGNQNCWNGNGGPGMGQKGMRRGGPGMHHGAMMNPEMRQKVYAFLDATKDLRKKMHDMRFVYMEAQRNPDITQGELQKQEQELYTLRQEIQTKRMEFFKCQVPQ